MGDAGKARRAVLALVLVAGVIGFGAGAASSVTEQTRWPATIRCADLAEDSAGHVRLVVFDRRADGSVRLVYRCEREGY